jgi:CubicO group peptidase (beta-lactamase class C family)
MISRVRKNFGTADGGMIISAADLELWVKHLFIYQDVIPKAQLKEMLTTVQVTSIPLYPANTGYGLGVLVSKDKKLGDMIWYTGVVPGYTSSLLPTDFCIWAWRSRSINRHKLSRLGRA